MDYLRLGWLSIHVFKPLVYFASKLAYYNPLARIIFAPMIFTVSRSASIGWWIAFVDDKFICLGETVACTIFVIIQFVPTIIWFALLSKGIFLLAAKTGITALL